MINSLLLKELEEGRLPTRDEALTLLQSDDADILRLLQSAYEVRKARWGKTVHIQYLKNAKSGNCSEDCHYCSQSAVSCAEIDKYPLLPQEELLAGSRTARDLEAKRFCMALSGKYLSEKETRQLCETFREIKSRGPLDLCCSLGFLSSDQARRLKEAGLDRVNHNLNTSRRFYSEICTTHSYDERIENIRRCKEAGLEICSGGIIGQGESDEDILDLLFELKEIDPDSVPLNFLIPQKGTPFADRGDRLSPLFCLKVLAVARFLLPEKEIRLAGGREHNLRSLQPLALYCVNSIFVRGYLTTDGQREDEAIGMIRDLGFDLQVEGSAG